MNPLAWKRQHQLAWLVIVLMGAFIGLLLGWLWSPFSHVQGTQVGVAFAVWLEYPGAYWPWLFLGMSIAALAFYAVQLCRD